MNRINAYGYITATGVFCEVGESQTEAEKYAQRNGCNMVGTREGAKVVYFLKYPTFKTSVTL